MDDVIQFFVELIGEIIGHNWHPKWGRGQRNKKKRSKK